MNVTNQERVAEYLAVFKAIYDGLIALGVDSVFATSFADRAARSASGLE